MPRRRLAALGTLGAAALAAAGVAAAGHRAQTTQQAAATFTATAVSHNRTTGCVGSDGSYQNTTATYTGSSTSADGRLSGSLVIRAHSILNTSTGNGWVDGSFRIRASDGGAHGTIHAAVANGKAVGAITGTANRPAGKLVASLAADFSQSGGFGNGALGTGTAGGAGTIFSRGACTKAKRLAYTAVFPLRLTGRQVVGSSAASQAGASGNLTLDVTRSPDGAISGAQVVFYVNYRFASPVNVTALALYQGARGSTGPQVVASGASASGTSRGTLARTVTGIPASTAQDLLAHSRDYYVQLDTSGGALRSQLGGYRRR